MKSMVGLAEIDITPDFKTSLGGYNRAIPRKTEGVHDRIFAKALSLELDGLAAVILSVPSVEIPDNSTGIIRSRAAATLNIPEADILVHATHSHSCPRCEGEYQKFLERKCVQCIKESFENRFCGKIGFGSAVVNECGKNRRRLLYGGMPVDPEIVVMKVADEQGVLRAVVYNYACHCTVLGVDNKLVSEDWPYFCNELLKQQKGSAVSTIFLQGTSGDVNPGYSAGLSAVGANIPTRTWAEASRIGEKIGEVVLGIIDNTDTEIISSLKLACHSFSLPARTEYPVSLEEAENNYKQAKLTLAEFESSGNQSMARLDEAKVNVFFASLVKRGAEDFYSGKWDRNFHAEILSIAINDNVISTFPCEVFCEDGMNLKRRSPFKHTMLAELSNLVEAQGYIPSASAYQDRDYEVLSSRYSKDAANVLIKESLKNLEKLLNQKV